MHRKVTRRHWTGVQRLIADIPAPTWVAFSENLPEQELFGERINIECLPIVFPIHIKSRR